MAFVGSSILLLLDETGQPWLHGATRTIHKQRQLHQSERHFGRAPILTSRRELGWPIGSLRKATLWYVAGGESSTIWGLEQSPAWVNSSPIVRLLRYFCQCLCP